MRIKSIIATFALLFGVGLALVPAGASAINLFETCDKIPAKDRETGVCSGTDDKILGNNGVLRRVINLLLFVIGIVAVIMVIVGGIKFTTSDGDSSKTKSARDTIIYAVVGLVVAIMSYAIVNWVLNRL